MRRYVAIIVPPVLALLLAVYQQVRAVGAGYELENLRGEITTLTVERENLEGEVSLMKRPEQLLSRAEKLGMRFELPRPLRGGLAMVGQER